ncbi:MAG TPA: PQQ-binding-like beta-propeller repeat protein [Draconibacterium sp.]|nr:PQQ-binding-like beta-propeller repeat protein [Draconibacterium sp.]
MRSILIIALFFSFVFSAQSQLVQWRGPNRDGHFTEAGLLKQWPADGPKQILQVDKLGKGWSSPIYTDGTIYITGMIDTLDYLSAVDMQGNILWQVPYGRSWNQSYPDTRCSPVIEDNRIYVQSGTGRVVCFDRETGKENWAVDVDKKFECEYHVWGNSETPLIIDDKLICSPGGDKTSVVALNKMTGETVWQSESLGGARAYASATIYEYKDFRYILAVIGTDILALVPETGEIAWHYHYFDPEKWTWQDNGLIWTNTPLFKDDEIFISMGYDYDAVMLKMAPDGKSVSVKYKNNVLDNHHGGLILYDGKVYGANWESNNKGNWACMDWNTGDISFDETWGSKGSLVMADGMLYTYNERGGMGLVKPVPDKFTVVSEFKITEGAGPHWAHPFIADKKLFMRHGEVLMVFDIKAN